MEKHIDEMHELSESIYMSGCALDWEDRNDIAEHLYNAGYRKQSVGEWVRGKTNYRTLFCSKCGSPKPYRKLKAGYHLLFDAKYCPNCGAKMKGADNAKAD